MATFGITTIGDLDRERGGANALVAQEVTLPVDGYVSSISAHTACTVAGDIKAVILNSSNQIVAVTPPVSVGTTKGVVQFPFSNLVLLTSGNYLLGLVSNTAGNLMTTIALLGVFERVDSNNYATPVDVVTYELNLSNSGVSIFAEYVPASDITATAWYSA